MTLEPMTDPSDMAEDMETEEDTSVMSNDINGSVRRGLEMAKLTVSMVLEPTIAGEEGFEIPQETNPDELSLIGLGSGSRACH